MEERGICQAVVVPSVSKGYSPCPGEATFDVDISMVRRQVSTLVRMWVFCQNLPSPVQEFPGPPAPRRMGFVCFFMDRYLFSRLTGWGVKSFPRLTPSLLAPPGGSKKTCTVKLLLFVFIHFIIFLGFKVVLAFMIMVSRLEKRKHLCN